MADIYSSETRSYNMSQVKGKDTKPEILIRKFLFAKGFRFRLHSKNLPGKPDIILPKYKIVIFINGCFWHGHSNCKYFSIPKTHTEWWMLKINNNKKHDEKVISELQQAGWKVIIVWTCQLKPRALEKTLITLSSSITNLSTQ